MKRQIGIFLSIILASGLFVGFAIYQKDDSLKIFLDKSGPYIGADIPQNSGYLGEGIRIGVIDTGVDHNHPDLFGFGEGGKVIGGKNFVEEGKMPIDTNGHGTQVAGIIAADGNLRGVAPKAKILSYKVSDDGESVSSDLIIKAIEQAILDDVDIINISLGVNRTNSRIDEAVNRAVESGIIVVAAAGNDGPGLGTIGSPGKDLNAITVGATYNNVTSSIVATLEVDGRQFQVIPLVGTSPLKETIQAELLFGKFAREQDLQERDYSGSIILAERGSDTQEELVYFSLKESNAADAGARSIIIYNNQPGIFLGELLHNFTEPDYYPRIPAISMSREDGFDLREMLENKTTAKIDVFYHPDFVTFFSSRGPVSPFYIKPDLVAPGVFVNTTLTESTYNFTSGTSFAAPHVSGAAALLLQKNPYLSPNEMKSIILTTTDQVYDAYGNKFPSTIAGFGRLNVTRAFDANLIIEPPFLVFGLSEEKKSDSGTIKIKSIKDQEPNFELSFDGPDFVEFDYEISNDRVKIFATLKEQIYGDYDARVFLDDGDLVYNIPVVLHITRGSFVAYEDGGKIKFNIASPGNWTFAKISTVNKDTGETITTSTSPGKKAEIDVYRKGEYWITAQISAKDLTFEAYEKINVTSEPDGKKPFMQFLAIPTSALGIIIGITVTIVVVSLAYSRTRPKKV